MSLMAMSINVILVKLNINVGNMIIKLHINNPRTQKMRDNVSHFDLYP